MADLSEQLGSSSPEAADVSTHELITLTEWIRGTSVPIFSLLISRNGKLVYELYTSGIDGEQSHYLMSVTKSVVSVLVGIAIDRHLLPGPDAPLTASIPRSLFASDDDFRRFQSVTLRRVLGMAALDAPDPPRRRDAEAMSRQRLFLAADNRVVFALRQPILSEPFQYNDETPILATGMIQYSAGVSALEFAEEHLFRPMGFRHYEWMHQDRSGIDNGGYGLRLRPIDMHKLGILFLNHGRWRGKQIVSPEWIERSFSPWNRSHAALPKPDYGWYWWAYRYGPGWTTHLAKGWKGQRIAVVPDQNIVVTMTACIQDGSEDELFNAIMKRIVMPAVAHGTSGDAGVPSKKLGDLLDQVLKGPSRIGAATEERMIPSANQKMIHRPFHLHK